MAQAIKMLLFYLSLLAASFLFSFLINSLFLRFASNLGIRDKKETIIRWSNTSKPAFGGISFYIIFLLCFASYSIFFEPGKVLLNKQMLGLLGTVTAAFCMGLADDAYNTRPFLKFFVQLLCGATLCYAGFHITIFNSMSLNYLVTILWIAGIMNSVNMLDNMDSIAAIVALFIFGTAALLISLNTETQNNIFMLILIGLIGSLSGFLIFNWHPSRLYMGDTGSQVIGLLLGVVGVRYFWNNTGSFDNGSLETISRQVVMVVTAFILPLTDTLTVVINRLSKGKSPFVGGKDHTTHHLFFRGITEKRIAILFAIAGLVSMLIVYYIHTRVSSWHLAELIVFSLYPAFIAVSLFTVTRLKHNIVNAAENTEEVTTITGQKMYVKKKAS